MFVYILEILNWIRRPKVYRTYSLINSIRSTRFYFGSDLLSFIETWCEHGTAKSFRKHPQLLRCKKSKRIPCRLIWNAKIMIVYGGMHQLNRIQSFIELCTHLNKYSRDIFPASSLDTLVQKKRTENLLWWTNKIFRIIKFV